MPKTPHTNAANKYARDVRDGKIIVGDLVRLACVRHLDDLERAKKASFPYKFDRVKAEKILNFAHLMPHIRGKWRGTMINLEPWQKFALAVPFGWVKKSDGLRRFREIYDEIPRKNGKSVLAAIVGNYMMTEDGEPGAEVYSGATTRAQAMEVFKPAWMMTKMADGYEEHYGLRRAGTDENPGTIHCVDTGSKFEPLTGDPGDGPSPHCAIVDEYHEHRKPSLYNTQKTGMGSREQPMLMVITTAGTDTSAPCYDKRNQALEVLRGNRVNEQLFVLIFTIDKDDDWQNFDVWKKANPNYGVSVFPDYLKAQYKDCLGNPREQNTLKCKHLNVWSDAGSAWMNMAEWEKAADPTLRLEDFAGESCYIGVDLASKIDITSFVILFRRDGHYYQFSRQFLPEARTQGVDFSHYAGWAHDGYITTTPGNMVDQHAIEEEIVEVGRTHNIVEIPHDTWNAAQFCVNMAEAGQEMIEVPMNTQNISEPMKNIEALVLSGRYHHDGNPCFDWMMGNVVARTDANDNIYPRKEKPESKIDGPVAAILAMSRAYVEQAAQGELIKPVFVSGG